MNDWKEVRIGDICKINRKSISPNSGTSYKLYSLPAFDNNRTPETVDGATILSSKLVLEPNTILYNKLNVRFSRIWNVHEIKDDHAICSTEFIPLKAAEGISQDYLYYLLSSRRVTDLMIKASNGTSPSQQRITPNALLNTVVSIPPYPEQIRIAQYLSDFDKKIDNNRKICDILEEQAFALYKRYFIERQPTTSKIKGELHKTCPPEWRMGVLSELGDIVGGATPAKDHPEYYTNNGIAWLTPKDLSNRPVKFTAKGEIDITDLGYKSASTKIMPRGAVLFSSRAPIGYISIAKNNICTNQGFKSIVPGYAGTCYLYFLLKEKTPLIEKMASGTTFKEASGSLMKNLQVIIPDKESLNLFEEEVRDMFEQQEVAESEILVLSSLRDTIQTNLISRTIRL